MNQSSITLTVLFDALNDIRTGISDNKVIEVLLPHTLQPQSRVHRMHPALGKTTLSDT